VRMYVDHFDALAAYAHFAPRRLSASPAAGQKRPRRRARYLDEFSTIRHACLLLA
jgi:hypothetical protein